MTVDRLARDNFINSLAKVVNRLCERKQGCTFAINGRWGCGKSFVLNLFRERILDAIRSESAGAPYYVFRYNCWQYDYYEEPAVAIVSALYDEIEDTTDQFKDVSEKAEALSRMAIEAAKKLTGNFLNSFLPFDVINLLEKFKTASETVRLEKLSAHAYDQYFSFKDALKGLTDALTDLSAEKPIVLLIDELDRCAPTYAVKVLERIHHIFNEQQNVVVILAIDQTHLKQSIQTVYSINDPQSISDYLKKYISFSLPLDIGHLSHQGFWDTYQDYLALFDVDDAEFHDGLENLPSKLFKNMDIRTQEKLMERIILLHKLSFTKLEAVNITFLYFELLHQTLSYLFHLHPCEDWEAKVTDPQNAPELKQSLGLELYFLITSLEQRSYTRSREIDPYDAESCSLKQLCPTHLACAFWLFANVANNKKGHPESISPYRLQNLSYPIEIRNGLPTSVKLFLEFSEQIEFW